ncbi:MAG: fumarylacetoacetase, partial [Actinomycetes bacterium]
MSWLAVPEDAPFGTAELPYGVFSTVGSGPRVGVAVADQVIDLAALRADLGHDPEHAAQPTLN